VIHQVCGDLLDQPVEVIVNAWNRNIIPWWLLIPQGVAGAIRRRAGTKPFREIARTRGLPLGHARLTSAGRLPFRGIIHVAAINMLWRSSEGAIRDGVVNAMSIVNEHGFASVAFPLLGAGTGGFDADRSEAIMLEALRSMPTRAEVYLVRYAPERASS
jgi:O-acetyl-ADP-ribose deacetylase (regulator of RNase III)